MHIKNHSKCLLVGGFSPIEKNARQNGFIFPNFGMDIKKVFELPPPSELQVHSESPKLQASPVKIPEAWSEQNRWLDGWMVGFSVKGCASNISQVTSQATSLSSLKTSPLATSNLQMNVLPIFLGKCCHYLSIQNCSCNMWNFTPAPHRVL